MTTFILEKYSDTMKGSLSLSLVFHQGDDIKHFVIIKFHISQLKIIFFTNKWQYKQKILHIHTWKMVILSIPDM